MTPGATVERLRILKRDSCDTESAENGNGQVPRVDFGTADVSFHLKASQSLVKNFLFSEFAKVGNADIKTEKHALPFKSFLFPGETSDVSEHGEDTAGLSH